MVAGGHFRAAVTAPVARYLCISDREECAYDVSLETIRSWLTPLSESPRQAPRLRPSIVDIWLLPASAGGALQNFSDLLTDADRNAARRHRHLAARRRWLVSRAMLRGALQIATRGRVPARDWQFQTGASGRPSVAAGLPQVSFSLSKSEAVSAIAVSTRAAVGVDVEGLDEQVDESLISCFASPRERAALGAGHGGETSRDFLKLWTLKEAYAKMLGVGLSADFARLEFSLEPVRFLGAEPVGLRTWTMTFEGKPCQLSLAFRPAATAQIDAQFLSSERLPEAC